jgi:excisionase family DNA binding protein
MLPTTTSLPCVTLAPALPERRGQLEDTLRPDPAMVRLYDQWCEKTGDANAAATLVLAQMQSTGWPFNEKRGQRQTRIVLTPPQAAKQLGVDPATVIGWIRSKQLKASNIGKGGQRPRFRIQQSDLEAFLKSRQQQSTETNKRRAKQQSSEIEFF